MLALLATGFGCSFQLKRADKLLLDEKFEAAEREYLEFLASNPTNSHAIYGRDSARRGLIGQRLLEVRHLRLAGNGIESFELLSDIVKTENNWQAFPVGAEFSTQREETDYAWDRLVQLVDEPLKENHPIVSEAYINGYRHIFGSKSYEAKVSQLSGKVAEAGRGQCTKFSNKIRPTHDLYAALVRSYCNHWSKGLEKSVAVNHDRYFKGLKIRGVIEGLPVELSESIRLRLQESFEQSPWYSPEATTIVTGNLTGIFRQSSSEEPIVKVHEYTVSVPYTEMVAKVGSRQVPYEAVENRSAQVPYTQYESQYNYFTRQTELVPTTQYRTVYYTETVTKYQTEYFTYTEPETRYRDDPRQVPYEATQYHQAVLLMAKLEFKVGGQSVSIPLNVRDSKNGTYHHNSSPEIGLYPEPKREIDAVQWVRNSVEGMAGQVVQQGLGFWERRYCKPIQVGDDPSDDGENILQCMKATNSYHVADDWSNKFFGIPLSKLQSEIIASK